MNLTPLWITLLFWGVIVLLWGKEILDFVILINGRIIGG